MMTQSNLITLKLDRSVVQNSSAQPRAKGARSFPFRYIGLHNGIGILLDNLEGLSQCCQVLWQDLFRKPRLALIEINGQQFKSDRGSQLQISEHREGGETVLA